MVNSIAVAQPSLSCTALCRTVLAKRLPIDRPKKDGEPTTPSTESPTINGESVLVGRNGQRFKMGPLLGKGGMSEVYSVTDSRGRLLAAKIPNSTDDKYLQRFRREINLMREASDLNGVIHLIVEGESSTFIVMEYAEGGSLKDQMDLNSMTPMQQLLVLADVCGHVEALHHHKDRKDRTQPIIHRDLKPANILFLLKRSEPKISDFGLAALQANSDLSNTPSTVKNVPGSITATGDILGSPGYMAPEQVDPSKVPLTTATDRYALGVMIYEILTGDLPTQMEGRSVMEFLIDLTHGTLVDIREKTLRNGLPPLPNDLARAVMVSLNKNPSNRTVSPGCLQREIERYVESNRVIFSNPAASLYSTPVKLN